MDERRQEIIGRVGRGELTPDDALRLLDALDEDEARRTTRAAGPVDPDGAASGSRALPPRTQVLPPGAESPIRTLKVHLAAGKVRIVGDPTVAGVEAEGPHTMHDEGNVLVVQCEPLGSALHEHEHERGFVLLGSGRRGPSVRLPWEGGRSVRIRANPSLSLEFDVAAGSASVDGMHGPITCDVSGGSVAMNDVRGPFQCAVSAGSLSVSGTLREGDSKLMCSMGSATVRLEPGSSVRVRVAMTMGKAVVRVGERRTNEWVVGDGRGLLAVEGTMSSVTVSEG